MALPYKAISVAPTMNLSSTTQLLVSQHAPTKPPAHHEGWMEQFSVGTCLVSSSLANHGDYVVNSYAQFFF
jgi:hypothetical protein